jgi:hypothetical protein
MFESPGIYKNMAHECVVGRTLQSTDSTPVVSQASSTLAIGILSFLLIFTTKSVAMSAQSVRKAKRPRVVTNLERKLKIVRNVEVDISCYEVKKVLVEMKKLRIK